MSDHEYVLCARCGGSGIYDDDTGERCVLCDGTGLVPDDDDRARLIPWDRLATANLILVLRGFGPDRAPDGATIRQRLHR
jgi:hypothetical protein